MKFNGIGPSELVVPDHCMLQAKANAQVARLFGPEGARQLCVTQSG